MTYRYVGHAATALHGAGYDIALTKYGQKVELSEDVARDHFLQGASLMTEENFKAVGHSDEEVEKYAGIASAIANKANTDWQKEFDSLDDQTRQGVLAFSDKRDKAWSMIAESRAKLLQPIAPPEPLPANAVPDEQQPEPHPQPVAA